MDQLGGVRRKRSVEKEHSYEMNPAEPKFTAKYLGKKFVLEEFHPSKSYPITAKYCEILVRESGSTRKARKMELLISKNILRGLCVTDPTGKVQPETYQLQNIAFCSTNKQNSKLFSFIVEQEGRLECHAFMCSKEAKAKAICVSLSRAFMSAHGDWSRNRERSTKKKETQLEVARVQTDIMRAALDDEREFLDGNEEESLDGSRNYMLATEDDMEEYENDNDVVRLLQGDCSVDD